MLRPLTLGCCPALRLCLFLKLMLWENYWAQASLDIVYLCARYIVIGVATLFLAVGCAFLVRFGIRHFRYIC